MLLHFCERLVPNHHLDRASEILDHHDRKRLAVLLRELPLHRRELPRDGHDALALLRGKFRNRHVFRILQRAAVFVERMASDVKSEQLFFKRELLRERPRRHRRPAACRRRFCGHAHVAEERLLPRRTVAMRARGGGHRALDARKHRRAIRARLVERAGFHEALDCFFADALAVHSRAKVHQVPELPAARTLRRRGLHRGLADIFDRRQAVADRAEMNALRHCGHDGRGGCVTVRLRSFRSFRGFRGRRGGRWQVIETNFLIRLEAVGDAALLVLLHLLRDLLQAQFHRLRGHGDTRGLRGFHSSGVHMIGFKFQTAAVDVRRHDFDPEPFALGDEDADLVRVRDFVAHHRGHEFHGVIRLQECRLVTEPRVRGGVRTVESIAGEFFQRVEDFVRLVLLDAVQLCRARAKLDALLGHLFLVLLAHRATEQICAAERVAREHLRGLHDLLLIDEHAVGFARDFIEQLVRRAHFREALLALHVVGDEVHRAGPVERDECVDVLDAAHVELLRPARHAAGLDLEHRDSLAAVVDVEARLVVERDRVDVEIGRVLVNQHDGIGDDGERLQAEEVALQHADLRERMHRVLADDRAVIRARERDVFAEVAVADDHTRRMHADTARETFELRRRLPHLRGVRVRLHGLREFGILVDRAGHMLIRAGVLVLLILAGERDAELVRDHLGDAIRVVVVPVEHARHVAHHGLCAKRAERDDLRDGTLAVFLFNVVNHLAAAVLAEIHVDIRRRHALGIQEALEEQFELQRINVRDAHRISDHRACRRAASGTDGNPLLPRPVDEVPDDQEIVHETLLFEQVDFERVASLHRLAVRVCAVAFAQSDLGDLAKIFVAGLSGGRLVVGILRRRVELEAGALRDGQRVVASPIEIREQRAHFLGRFEVHLVHVLHALLVRDFRTGADADQHIMRAVILLVQKMHVIRRDEAEAQIACELRQMRVHFPLRLDAVVGEFQEEIFPPEDVTIRRREFGRLREIVLGVNRVRHLTLQTAAQSDDSLRMLREQFLVDPRLVVKAVEMRRGHEAHEVLIALQIRRQQRQMKCGFLLRHRGLFQVRIRRDIHLAADDGLDARLVARLVKFHCAIHRAMIRDRERRHSHLLRLFHRGIHPHHPVERGEFRVAVEMDEAVRHCPDSMPCRVASKREFSVPWHEAHARVA